MTNEERIAVAKKAVCEALGRDVLGRHEIVGSTYIKDKDSSDVDVLVFDESFHLDEMSFGGWEYGGSNGMGNDHWMSWKHCVDGVEVNMLLTSRRDYFDAWLTAAEVSRFLHLQGYNLRTATVHGIHEIIMEDTDAESENKNRVSIDDATPDEWYRSSMKASV
jgi:predicted nucleotidyltransferase